MKKLALFLIFVLFNLPLVAHAQNDSDFGAIFTGDPNIGVLATVGGDSFIGLLTTGGANGEIETMEGLFYVDHLGNRISMFLGDDGLPERAVFGDVIVEYRNFTEVSVDLLIIPPEGAVEFYPQVRASATMIDYARQFANLEAQAQLSGHVASLDLMHGNEISLRSFGRSLAAMASAGAAYLGAGTCIELGAAAAGLSGPGAFIVGGIALAACGSTALAAESTVVNTVKVVADPQARPDDEAQTAQNEAMVGTFAAGAGDATAIFISEDIAQDVASGAIREQTLNEVTERMSEQIASGTDAAVLSTAVGVTATVLTEMSDHYDDHRAAISEYEQEFEERMANRIDFEIDREAAMDTTIDFDGDGLTTDDACPARAGLPENDGCPVPLNGEYETTWVGECRFFDVAPELVVGDNGDITFWATDEQSLPFFADSTGKGEFQTALFDEAEDPEQGVQVYAGETIEWRVISPTLIQGRVFGVDGNLKCYVTMQRMVEEDDDIPEDLPPRFWRLVTIETASTAGDRCVDDADRECRYVNEATDTNINYSYDVIQIHDDGTSEPVESISGTYSFEMPKYLVTGKNLVTLTMTRTPTLLPEDAHGSTQCANRGIPNNMSAFTCMDRNSESPRTETFTWNMLPGFRIDEMYTARFELGGATVDYIFEWVDTVMGEE